MKDKYEIDPLSNLANRVYTCRNCHTEVEYFGSSLGLRRPRCTNVRCEEHGTLLDEVTWWLQ